MAKLVFVASLIGITLISTAAAVPSISTAFQLWLDTFDPSNAVATKSTDCTNKPNGFYPNEPDTCSDTYVACFSGVAYPQDCRQGWVFDADAGSCVNRGDATSSACLSYPPPTCDGTNNGLYQPTAACSEIYYICIGGQLYIQSCNSGEFFNPSTLVCERNDLTGACSTTKPPVTVPPYGCSDKIRNFAYAITTCSSSFYTCDSPSSPPTPGACEITGTVFDYEKEPAPVDSNSCISRTTAPGCLLTTTPAAQTSTSTVATTTSSTTTTEASQPSLPTAPCVDCVEP